MKLKGILVLLGVICLAAVFMVFYGRTLTSENDLPGNTAKEREMGKKDKAGDFITLHYHERKPYYEKKPDGIYGLCADPTQRAFEKAGIPFQWRQSPAKRQLKIIKDNRGLECAVGWFKNSEREQFAKFTRPIYQDKPTMALARFDNDIIESGGQVEKIMTNRRLTLLRKDGYSYGKFIDEKIQQYKPREVVTTGDNNGMLKMIHAHRADYFFLSEEEALDLIASSGFSPKDFKFIRFSDMPAGNKRYILCSLKVDDALMKRIDEAISQGNPEKLTEE